MIDQLRRLAPAEWRYDRLYGVWRDVAGGRVVTPVSHHSPIYDGDEDRYVTRYQLDFPRGPYLSVRDDRAYSSDGVLLER